MTGEMRWARAQPERRIARCHHAFDVFDRVGEEREHASPMPKWSPPAITDAVIHADLAGRRIDACAAS